MLKGILTQLIIISIVVAIAALSFSGLVNGLSDILSKLSINENINLLISDFIAEDFSAETMANDLTNFIFQVKEVLSEAQGLFRSLLWANLLIILMVCAYRYLLGFTDIPTVEHLSEFMQTGNARPFTWYFFKKFPDSAKFLLAQMAITTLIDGMILFGAIGFYVFVLSSMRTIGVILAVLLLLFTYSVRQALFAFWLPELVTKNVGIMQAFRNGLTKIINHFWSVLWKTLSLIGLSSILTILINYLLQDFVTFNWLAAILTAIINLYSFYLIKCVNMVEYFETENSPYFITKLKLDIPDLV